MSHFNYTFNKVFKCTLKTRFEMERDIPPDSLGWWHDCCPGRTLELRQATRTDIDRCWLRKNADKNPVNYMVEIIDRGCLVHKDAIAKTEVAGLPVEKVSSAFAELRASLKEVV